MSRKDNDSLEEFFRKATRQHDLEYNEADWKKLERMLDEQQPARPVGWLKRHGPKALIAAAFLGGVVAVLLLLPGRQPKEFVPANQGSEADAGISATPKEKEVPEAPMSASDDAAVARDDGGASEVGDVRDDRNVANDPATRSSERTAVLPTDAAGDQPAEPVSGNMNQEQHLSDVSGFGQKQIEVPAPTDRIEKTLSAEETVKKAQDQPADSASADQTADALEAPAKRSAFDETRGRFSISVIAAPDFSMTAKGGAMGAGDAVGVYLHYRALPRWSVTAGVLYDTKNYWGQGNEYRPPKGYWKALTNGVVPERIEGTCAMYEVPVSVTFDILSTRRTRLFASAGLSSYFVQNEEYYYHFDTPNPGAVRGWTSKEPSTLWFGIGTLSAGFDFMATRNLSLGVEPYFKVPLEGMGWADIDLYSTGVMFAARYHFTKKANKHPPTIQGP